MGKAIESTIYFPFLMECCFDILEYYSTSIYSDLFPLRWHTLPYPAVLGLAIRLNLTNGMFMEMSSACLHSLAWGPCSSTVHREWKVPCVASGSRRISRYRADLIPVCG